MLEPFGYVEFCDDIRAEPGGKRSLIGIYGSEYTISGAGPTVIGKLCIFCRIYFPNKYNERATAVRISYNEWARESIVLHEIKTKSPCLDAPEKRITLRITKIVINDLRIERGGVIRCVAVIDGVNYPLGSLDIKHSGKKPAGKNEANPISGDLEWTVRVIKPVPESISCIIGDAIHKLRAVFDFIAWEIAKASSQPDRVSFPISKTSENYWKYGVKKISPASSVALAVVEKFQPYHGGDRSYLDQMHQLDIADKHRILLPVATSSHQVGINHIIEDFAPDFTIWLNYADKPRPLRNGEVKFRVPLSKRLEFNSKDPSSRIEIAFNQIIVGEPVVPTLLRFAAFCRTAIEEFDREVFL